MAATAALFKPVTKALGLDGGGTPAITPAPTAPTREDPSIADAARRARQAQAAARGRGSTILTNELGVTGGNQGNRRRLLGG